MDKAGASCYCKTSGATGMHLYVPLGARYDFDQAEYFAQKVAQLVHEQLPQLTSLERSPKARRKQIYLDYLQNNPAQTLAAAYSVRPKPGATVSTPLQWNEVRKGLHPSQFTIQTVPQRLQNRDDVFKGILGKGVDLDKCIANLNL
jgi:bifunctional non-homologous end joining protein LigD